MERTVHCAAVEFYAGFEQEVVDPPVTVPEPGAIALLGLALAGLGIARRRQQH